MYSEEPLRFPAYGNYKSIEQSMQALHSGYPFTKIKDQIISNSNNQITITK